MDKWGQPKRPIETALSDVDTRALRVLLTLLDCRSVTLAAVALGLSQPSVSQTLRKMRELTDDRLLVRSGAKLVLTERAQTMIEPLRQSLASLEEIIKPAKAFDPTQRDYTFRIASADCMEAFFLPRLIARIRAQAPASRIMLRSVVANFDYAAALESGELDVVIGNWPSPPDNLRTVRLLSDDMVCIFGRDHPLNQKRLLTLAEYMTLEHVAPAPLSPVVPGPIDGRLAEMGLSRDIRVMLPEFNLVPYVLMSTDLVFTSSRNFARHYEALLPISSVPAPEEFGRMNFYLLWHERAQNASANQWLRAQIAAVAHNLET